MHQRGGSHHPAGIVLQFRANVRTNMYKFALVKATHIYAGTYINYASLYDHHTYIYIYIYIYI